MKQKEVLGSGNAMGTTKILVANSKREEIFKLKDDTITINLNNMETKKVTLANESDAEFDGKMIEAVEFAEYCMKNIFDIDYSKTTEEIYKLFKQQKQK